MAMYEASKEFVSKALSLLSEVGDVIELNYPRDQLRRTVDLALKVKNREAVLLKLAYDAELVGKDEREELKGLSFNLKLNALIVAERRDGAKLVEGVVYDYGGSKLVSVDTLLNSVEGNYPAIYEEKDEFKVKINGEAMRSRRTLKGHSLGSLARAIKVSRKAIYDYEHEAIRPTLDVAERLVRELGEDIVAGIDIFGPSDDVMATSTPSLGTKPESPKEMLLARKLEELDMGFCHTRKAPLDFCLSRGEFKALVTVPHGSEKPRELSNKIHNMLRMAEFIGSRSFVVTDDSPSIRELSWLDNTLTIEEFESVLGEIVAAATEEDNRDNRKARNREDNTGADNSQKRQ